MSAIVSRSPSPDLSNNALPNINLENQTDASQSAEQIKLGAQITGHAVKDSFAGSGVDADKTKAHAKEAGHHLGNAGRAGLDAATAAAHGVGHVVDQVGANAGQAREGLNQAGTGAWNLAPTPLGWGANKISGLGTNLTTPRLNERFSPAFGAALALGGTALFAAAAAASWSATLFINLPTLALGTALTGATLMSATLLRRAFGGPSAPSTSEGVLATGTVADRTGADMEERRKVGLTTVQTQLAAVRKEKDKLVKKQTVIAERNAKLETELAQLLKQEAIHESYKIARQDVAILAEAAAINPESLPPVKAAEVKIVATTSDVQQGNESELNAEIVTGGNLGKEAIAS